ncbi:hypothetical protein IQ07DRAFT_682207 [Pyrenochaeta sp. DS3sAY3a]|nr:hypothetical protein IQ07DRAFT_682207 [Pyrenochaeta sp. DS3sAY3a]
MANKLRFSIILLPLALFLQLILLASEVVILQAGTGPLKNKSKLPRFSALNIVVIDTDQYSRTVNDQTFQGLPDSHDFSKDKGVFGIFVGNYCSGKKNGDRYEVDYCSPWGKQFFDLHRLWRVWGVDLIKDNLIGTTPKLIFIGFLTTTAATLLCTCTLIISFCSYRAAGVATLLSVVATISIIATAGLSQRFVQRLQTYVPNSQSTGKGKLVIHGGTYYLRSVWIGSGLALLSTIFCIISVHAKRQHRRASRLSKTSTHGGGYSVDRLPLVGIVRRATSDLLGQRTTRGPNYKHLAPEEVELTNASHENLVEKSKAGGDPSSRMSHSRDGSNRTSRSREVSQSGESLYGRGGSGRKMQDSTAYEPLRHHDGA